MICIWNSTKAYHFCIILLFWPLLTCFRIYYILQLVVNIDKFSFAIPPSLLGRSLLWKYNSGLKQHADQNVYLHYRMIFIINYQTNLICSFAIRQHHERMLWIPIKLSPYNGLKNIFEIKSIFHKYLRAISFGK